MKHWKSANRVNRVALSPVKIANGSKSPGQAGRNKPALVFKFWLLKVKKKKKKKPDMTTIDKQITCGH